MQVNNFFFFKAAEFFEFSIGYYGQILPGIFIADCVTGRKDPKLSIFSWYRFTNMGTVSGVNVSCQHY